MEKIYYIYYTNDTVILLYHLSINKEELTMNTITRNSRNDFTNVNYNRVTLRPSGLITNYPLIHRDMNGLLVDFRLTNYQLVLTRKQISSLVNISDRMMTIHLNNIYGELEENTIIPTIENSIYLVVDY